MFDSVYWVEPCAELELAISVVKERIPCFISLDPLCDGISVFWIKCRAEDMAFVERMIAPFV